MTITSKNTENRHMENVQINIPIRIGSGRISQREYNHQFILMLFNDDDDDKTKEKDQLIVNISILMRVDGASI